MKIIMLTGSPHTKGAADLLAGSFARGTQGASCREIRRTEKIGKTGSDL